jgi:glucokinase
MPLEMSLFRARNASADGVLILAADVGGTKTLLSLCIYQRSELRVITEKKFPSKSYTSLNSIIKEFLSNQETPSVISIAVAGPVTKGKVNLTNLNWQVSEQEIKNEFNAQEVFLLNDLEATAYGLSELHGEDFMVIHNGDESIGGNMAIIAPGTGLGEAGLYWDGNAYHPFASEGGHCDYAPRSAEEIELYKYLHHQFDHVSWERVVSGQGIFNIYSFLKEHRKHIHSSLDLSGVDDPAALISQRALKGDDPLSKEAIGWFVKFMAYEAANLALKIKSTGGLFIGGGIPPKLRSLIKPAEFMFFFKQCGRLSSLLEQMPVRLVLNEKTALLGAIRRGRYHDQQAVVNKVEQ